MFTLPTSKRGVLVRLNVSHRNQQPLVVRPGHVPRLGDAQVDAEIAVTAEHVARPTLTRVVEPQKLERLLGRDRERTRLASRTFLVVPVGGSLDGSLNEALPCRFQLVAQQERQL